MTIKLFRPIALVATTAVLAACGGSDDSDEGSSSSQSSVSSSTSSSAASSSSSVANPSNLVVHYAFEEDFSDSGPNAMADATVTAAKPADAGGSVSFVGTGKEGSAAYFDSTSGLSLPTDLLDDNSYTISFWMQPEALTDFTSVFFAQPVDSSGWLAIAPRMGAEPGTVWVRAFTDDFNDAPTDVALSIGSWYHVALTVNGPDANLYIDGVEADIGDLGASFPNFADAESSVVALAVNPWDTPYQGLIDEFKIHSVALSQTEVEALAGVETSSSSSSESSVSSSSVDSSSSESSSSSSESSTSSEVSSSSVSSSSSSETSSSSSSPAVSAALLAHYPFEDSLADASGNGSDATVTGNQPHLTGGAITFATGVEGSAAYFDGLSGIRLPNNLINDYTYTIAFWIQAEALTDHTSAFFGVVPEENLNRLTINTHLPDIGEMWPMVDVNGTHINGFNPTKLVLNEWFHIALAVNESSSVFYVNGSAVNMGNETENLNNTFPDIYSTDATAEFSLGVNYWDTPFQGLMDDVRIYDEPLDAAAIAELASIGAE